MRDDTELENRAIEEAHDMGRRPEAIDGYLSTKAQQIDPGALVLRSGEAWILRRPAHPDLRLGAREDASFGEAQQALSAWIRAQKAGQ